MRILTTITILSIAAVGLTACAADSGTTAACESYDGVILVVGVHQNQPKPTLPSEVTCRLRETIVAGKAIGLVGVDGSPSVIAEARTFDVSAANSTDAANKLDKAYDSVLAAIADAQADSDGADLFAALRVAADAARSAQPAISEIVSLDSGISDRGDVAMTDEGMTLADGTEVADHLLDVGSIDSETFAGLDVDLLSLGYTALPQGTLSAAQQSSVADVYSSIIQAGGGTATVVPFPQSAPAATTKFVTGVAEVIEPPDIDFGAGDLLRFGVDTIEFVGDSAELVDPDKATAALEPVAAWLNAADDHRATITGRTSSANPSINKALSKRRADTVMSILISMKVDAAKMEPVGAGYTGNPPDRDDNGAPLPGAQALNRVVDILLGDDK